MNRLFRSQVWLLLALLPACGSDKNSGSGAPSTAELVASCNRTCDKMKACAGDAGSFINCDQICTDQNFTPRGAGGQSSAPACDYGKMKEKLDSCAQVACSELQACYAEAGRICADTGSGTGGTSGGTGGASTGSGGSSIGAGGTGTTGTCADCDRATTCCKTAAAQAGQDPASCDSFSSTTCAGIPAAQQSQFIQACTSLLAACP